MAGPRDMRAITSASGNESSSNKSVHKRATHVNGTGAPAILGLGVRVGLDVLPDELKLELTARSSSVQQWICGPTRTASCSTSVGAASRPTTRRSNRSIVGFGKSVSTCTGSHRSRTRRPRSMPGVGTTMSIILTGLSRVSVLGNTLDECGNSCSLTVLVDQEARALHSAGLSQKNWIANWGQVKRTTSSSPA